jgi:hypothetical protein
VMRYMTVGVVSGLLFAILDGVLNANPLAQRLFEVYKPIARISINPIAGIVIDLAYGFIMAGVFLLLYRSLPGETGVLKGASFAFLVWFFRVFMSTVSQWLMFRCARRSGSEA